MRSRNNVVQFGWIVTDAAEVIVLPPPCLQFVLRVSCKSVVVCDTKLTA